MRRKTTTWMTGAALLLLTPFSAIPTFASSGSDDQRDPAARIENLISHIQIERSPETRTELALQLSDLVQRTDPAEIGVREIDGIATLLSDRADSVRAWAAAALGDIGPPARRAIPALEKALRELPTLYAGSLMQPALDSGAAIVPALRKIGSDAEDPAPR